jgi:hypothetical protein
MEGSCKYIEKAAADRKRVRPPDWGLSVGLTTPHRIKPARYEMTQRDSQLMGSCENGNETSDCIKGWEFD